MKIFNKRYLENLKYCFKKKLPFSCWVQTILQFFGIAIHNHFRDECCIDFECCNPYKDDSKNKCWLHIHANQLPIRKEIWYEPTAPIGNPNRNFIKKSRWIFNCKKKGN